MLKLIIDSSTWVVRRVEHVAFLDECTVRRRVSIDYVAPEDAVIFRRASGQLVRILPIAIMRRKSLVKFDFRDHDGRALPLLGLRQNQALTLAIIRACAAAVLHEQDPCQGIEPQTDDFLDDVIAGDQTELWRAALCSAMGFTPTRIKFPVPAAELAGSFHFEISAPPEVSIVNAALLAGRPLPEEKEPAQAQPEPPQPDSTPAPARSQGKQSVTMKGRERRRPSFDSISGGYPTVDLHVTGVPYGSRSRAQVQVEARVGGWFGTAVFASWLASAILLFTWLARPQLGVGSTLRASFAGGLAVLLVRQDPHRLVTRLLSKVRQLATFAAVLALAAAVVMASNNPASAHGWLLGLFIASLVPTTLISASFLLALRRSLWAKTKESPWEHHRPRRSKLGSDDPELPAHLKDENRHETLARMMEIEDYPYDWAHRTLKFSEPAIRVASSEGDRLRYLWDKAFARTFQHRLDAYRNALLTRDWRT